MDRNEPDLRRKTLEVSGTEYVFLADDRDVDEGFVAVLVDGRPLARIRTETTLAELGRAELEALAEQARKEAALDRWEGEGGNPAPAGGSTRDGKSEESPPA